MSLMKTKPSWVPNVIATDRGWVDPVSGEVYVAIGNLAKLLANEADAVEQAKVAKSIEDELAEALKQKPAEYTVPEHLKEQVRRDDEPTKEETPMIIETPQTEELKQKRAYNKKPKVIGEVVEQPKDVKIIGEVVEYNVDTKVIGE